MKRDLDLMRNVLLHVEADDWGHDYAANIKITGKEMADVIYQAMLAWDNGLLDATDSSTKDGPNLYVRRLTSKGHDYLDYVRDQSAWGHIKRALSESALPPTVDMVIKVGDALHSRILEKKKLEHQE